MSRHRFFMTEPLPSVGDGDRFVVPLSKDDVHHAVDVLRIGPREELAVVEPDGQAWIVAVEAVVGREVTAIVISREARSLPGPHLTLIQSVAKGQTMDDIVQHAVELGVGRVIPVITERTVVRFDEGKAESRTLRWRRIAESAARQSQQARVPVVEVPCTLEQAVALSAGFDALLVMWEESGAPGIADALRRAGVDGDSADASVAIVIGPEGGLSAREVDSLTAVGAIECSLGPNILRAETAALAALVLASSALGGLGSGMSR